MAVRVLRRRGLATFVSLVVVAEVAGRSLTAHVDRALHLTPLAPFTCCLTEPGAEPQAELSDEERLCADQHHGER